MELHTAIDNKWTISSFSSNPAKAFLSPKGENNVDKKSENIRDYNVILDKIEKQSKSDFNQSVTLIIENKEIKTENLADLEDKIKEKFPKDAEKIIKKILSFPGQSSWDSFYFVQPFIDKNFNKPNDLPIISLQEQNIQHKIKITNNDVYLYTSCKFTIKNSSIGSFEPICIEESQKYRLNDQGKGKYTVPTLLAEHIAVFEAKPYVTENENLAYLKIGEKKSEFNWINPNQNPENEELVTFDVKKDAANDEKK